MGLTARQDQLLRRLLSFIGTKGYPPSQRQLAHELGCRHRSIQEILSQLEKKGYIRHEPGVSRSLRVLRSSNGPPPGMRA